MAGCMTLLVLFAALIVFTTGLANPFASRGADRAWRSLARELAGVYVGNGMFSRPSLRFQYGPQQVVLTVRRGETRLEMGWPDSQLQLELTTRAARSGSRLPEFTVGDERFDWTFQLRSDRPDDCRRLLNEGVRWHLLQLQQMRSRSNLRVELSRGRLLIHKAVRMSTYPELHRFVRTALDLYDQAMLTRAEGIEFVEEEVVQPLSEARCQVCGEDIVLDMVFCRRCKTPHHRECWDYYGSCTVYGCNESEYVVPHIAAPIVAEEVEEEESKAAEKRDLRTEEG